MEGYTTKEVLLSVKDKLCELERKLNHLKYLTIYSEDKNIKDIRYNVHNSHYKEKPELYCHVSFNDSNLNGKLKNFLIRSGRYIYGNESGIVLRDNNGNSRIILKNSDVFIPEERQEEFREVADEVLSDDFYNGFLKRHYIYPDKNGIDKSMEIYSNYIAIKSKTHDTSKPICFSYKPTQKEAKLTIWGGKELSDVMIQDLLNLRLSKDKFTDYRKDFMESSKEKDKEIIIPNFIVKSKNVDFTVLDDETGLRLIKK